MTSSLLPINSLNAFNRTDFTIGDDFIVIDRFDLWGSEQAWFKIDNAIIDEAVNNKIIIITRLSGFSKMKVCQVTNDNGVLKFTDYVS